MRRPMDCGMAAVLLCTLAGCTSVGLDSVAFVTRTNVAVDLDGTPATAEIGYKRDALVLAPTDTEGRVLPVLTTVATRPGIFEFGANHSFATGDAAILMSKHFASDADLDEAGGKDGKISYSDLVETVGKNGLDGNGIDARPENRRRYFFGTNTTMGLGVGWTAGTTVPTSVALGYKRKELAVVPLATVAQDQKDGKQNGTVKLSSLLATASAGSGVGAQADTRVQVSETFATGFAATLMASHPEVRAVLGPALVADFDEVARKRKELRASQEAALASYSKNEEAQNASVKEIAAAYAKEKDGAQRVAIVQLARKRKLLDDDVPDKLDDALFRKYLYGSVDGNDPKITDALEGLKAAVE